MKPKTRKSFDQLSPEEKEAIFRDCERLGPEDGALLTAEDRRCHRRAGLPVGRPRIGQGAKRINITMEKRLLKSADEFARRRGLTRAGLIAESVRAYLAKAA